MDQSQWTDTKCAYLAGILDGEGLFALCPVRGNKRATHGTQIIVGNTNTRLIWWLRENFGGTVNPRAARPNPRQKPLWVWLLSGASVEPVLRAVLPYLVLKREQAELLLEYRATVLPVGSNFRVTEEVAHRRSEMKLRMLALNQRGIA